MAEQLHLGAGWLEARIITQQTEAALARTERTAVALDILAIASTQRRLSRAATAVVNELAIRLRCDRVALGLTHAGGIKLRALSHAASFQKRGRIVDAIENSMEECLAQSAPIAFPASSYTATRISVAHRDLATLEVPVTAVASVPLLGPDGAIGVLTFERHGGAPFDGNTVQLAEATGALLGPVLRMHAANDRLVAGRIVSALQDFTKKLLGPDKRGGPQILDR